MKKDVLNLDKQFDPMLMPFDIGHELIKFSGGELHIKLNNDENFDTDTVVITHRVNSMDNLMEVLIAKDALERKGIKHFELVMPYIPYARQDRICNEGESFTLKVFASILNSAKFDKVICFDAHSDVTPALINNCVNISNENFVANVLCVLNDSPILISPDAGAIKKANKLAAKFSLDLVKCDKKRDTKTGKLSGFEVFADDLKGRDCLIVDDICDGGGTFKGLAVELRNKNAGKLHLFVTHGIFSKGYNELLYYFNTITCSNSFSTISNSSINQIKIIL